MSSQQRPIVVHGAGNSARITALSLAAAGFPVALHRPDDAPSPTVPDWQSVLALSPSAKRMLETLGVWERLDRPTTAVLDMRVYGDSAAVSGGVLAPRLGFAPAVADRPQTATDATNDAAPLAPLAHIVSLASLGRAIAAACDTSKLISLPAPVRDFDRRTKTATLADGSRAEAALLVDTQRGLTPWRRQMPARPLRHDYAAAALVGTLAGDQPHGQTAQQIFLPDGPLALLPLPDTQAMALVWSMPAARADALARLADDGQPAHIEAALAAATGRRFGRLCVTGSMATQKLELQLAERFFAGPVVLAGEAAHVIHPMAGQGFNLTLRDAALLADVLHEGRGLGLPADDAALLSRYATARRADAAAVAGLTHGLAGLFARPAGRVGRLGLAAVGRLSEAQPALARALTDRADHGSTLPRLMRGQRF